MSILLIVLGAIPFLVGSILNWFLQTYSDIVPPFAIIGILFLILWGILAFVFQAKLRKTKTIVILMNLIASIDLLLLAIQELILHAYWMNAVGAWSQFFYLPLINIGFTLTNWSHTVFPAYCACFVLMLTASFIGCQFGKKRKEQ